MGGHRSLQSDHGRLLLTLPDEDVQDVARRFPTGDVVSEEVLDLVSMFSPPAGEHAEAGVAVDKEDPPVTTCGYPTTIKTYDPTWDVVGAVYSTVWYRIQCSQRCQSAPALVNVV